MHDSIFQPNSFILELSQTLNFMFLYSIHSSAFYLLSFKK